jgi:hypothetical protein
VSSKAEFRGPSNHVFGFWAPERHTEAVDPPVAQEGPILGHSGNRSHPGAYEGHSPWSAQHSAWSSEATGLVGRR